MNILVTNGQKGMFLLEKSIFILFLKEILNILNRKTCKYILSIGQEIK